MNILISSLVADFIKPSFRRLGTAVGSSLTAYGASQGLSDQAETFIPLLAGFALDLLLSKKARS